MTEKMKSVEETLESSLEENKVINFMMQHTTQHA